MDVVCLDSAVFELCLLPKSGYSVSEFKCQVNKKSVFLRFFRQCLRSFPHLRGLVKHYLTAFITEKQGVSSPNAEKFTGFFKFVKCQHKTFCAAAACQCALAACQSVANIRQISASRNRASGFSGVFRPLLSPCVFPPCLKNGA